MSGRSVSRIKSLNLESHSFSKEGDLTKVVLHCFKEIKIIRSFLKLQFGHNSLHKTNIQANKIMIFKMANVKQKQSLK